MGSRGMGHPARSRRWLSRLSGRRTIWQPLRSCELHIRAPLPVPFAQLRLAFGQVLQDGLAWSSPGCRSRVVHIPAVPQGDARLCSSPGNGAFSESKKKKS